METRKEVKIIEIDYRCPKCEKGYLRNDGFVLTSNPPIYPHRCNNPQCDYHKNFSDIAYPYYEYVDVNEKI